MSNPREIARALAAVGTSLALIVPTAAHAQHRLDIERFDEARTSAPATPGSARVALLRATQDHDRRAKTLATRAMLVEDARKWGTLVEQLDRDLEEARKQAERDAQIRAWATFIQIAAVAVDLAYHSIASETQMANERPPDGQAPDSTGTALLEEPETREGGARTIERDGPVTEFGAEPIRRAEPTGSTMPLGDIDPGPFTFEGESFVEEAVGAGSSVWCDPVERRCLPSASATTKSYTLVRFGAGPPALVPVEIAGGSSAAIEGNEFPADRWLLEGTGPLASGAVDMHPVAGPVKAFVEFGTGHDLITGQKMPRWVAGIGLVPGVGGGVKTTIRSGGKWVAPLARSMSKGTLAKLAGKTGREAFGESGRAVLAAKSIESLGAKQLRSALKNTPLRWSDHALSRIRDPRMRGSRITTPGQIIDVLNNGTVRRAGGRSVAIQSKSAKLEIIVDVKRRTVLTVKPWKSRP